MPFMGGFRLSEGETIPNQKGPAFPVHHKYMCACEFFFLQVGQSKEIFELQKIH